MRFDSQLRERVISSDLGQTDLALQSVRDGVFEQQRRLGARSEGGPRIRSTLYAMITI